MSVKLQMEVEFHDKSERVNRRAAIALLNQVARAWRKHKVGASMEASIGKDRIYIGQRGIAYMTGGKVRP